MTESTSADQKSFSSASGLPDVVPVSETSDTADDTSVDNSADHSGVDDTAFETGATQAQVRREQRRILFRSPTFIIGCFILGFWILAALAPEFLANWEPKESVSDSSGAALRSTPPDGTAWFGTTRLGRDVYSRVIHGARPILVAAPLATALAAAAGTLLGLIMGYFRGMVDEVLSRILEAILAIPAILLAIVIVFTFGATQTVTIGVIAFLFVAPIARTVRAATLAEGQLDYVEAARLRGESSLFIVGREILPNVISVVIVEITVRLGYAIFVLATLAFLGLSGGNATDANWGIDVADNYDNIIAGTWWPTVFPALAIGSLVIGVNLIADSLQKVYDS